MIVWIVDKLYNQVKWSKVERKQAGIIFKSLKAQVNNLEKHAHIQRAIGHVFIAAGASNQRVAQLAQVSYSLLATQLISALKKYYHSIFQGIFVTEFPTNLINISIFLEKHWFMTSP